MCGGVCGASTATLCCYAYRGYGVTCLSPASHYGGSSDPSHTCMHCPLSHHNSFFLCLPSCLLPPATSVKPTTTTTNNITTTTNCPLLPLLLLHNRWLIIGPHRSGSSFHVDPNATCAWNAVVSGAKKWILFPPGRLWGMYVCVWPSNVSPFLTPHPFPTPTTPTNTPFTSLPHLVHTPTPTQTTPTNTNTNQTTGSPPPGVHPSPDGADVAAPVSIIEWFLNFYDEARHSKVRAVGFLALDSL